jgi:hypothetical protein
MQQQTQYDEQAKAQDRFIAVKEKEARAIKQKDVIDAVLSVDIAKNNAQAMREGAYGIRDRTMAVADGDAYQSREVGQGIADAYASQSNVIGPQILGLLKTFEKISDGQIKIVPEVLVTSGADQGGNNIINAVFALLLKEGALKITSSQQRQLPERKPRKDPLPSLPIETIPTPIESPIVTTTPTPSTYSNEPEPSPERIQQLND